MRRLGAVLAVVLLVGAAPAAASQGELDLERLTVAELQERMERGLSSHELTRAYLDRIEAVNSRGPGLNAVRILNPRALDDARALDRERRTQGPRGPLHGIPVLVKDNLDVAGLPTTAGSVALERSLPDRDSTVVAKLREAGAVILGKANLTEFANFMTNGMPSGYSSLGGQVLNPTDANDSPSGSSSGSGAAAAAGLAAVTIGTETSGSIVSPAAANGIVGLRPTVGLVSRAGILPISASQDTAGPMTRTVADAAAELQAIAGPDPEDPATEGQPPVPDYLGGLSETALQGARLGVVTSSNAQYQAAVAAVQAVGATTVPIATPQPSPNFPQILTQEFERDLNAYLGRLPASRPIGSLTELIAANSADAREALKFGQTQLVASEAVDLGDPAQLAEYEANRDGGRAAARRAIDDALSADDLDAILTPAGTLVGTGARAGYPQLTMPAGYAENDRNPVNVSFTGTAFSEATLLAFGHAYEQATRLRRPPSEINPSMWRCVGSRRPSCAPGMEVMPEHPPQLGFSLEEATVADLQERMGSRSLDSETLTEAYLARIALANTEGPSVNAVRSVNPRALQEAEELDKERRRDGPRGPLHGIPVLVKDNLDVAGMPTTAGSVALERSIPSRDSTVVANLREAGAVILGKLNLTEFANFMTNGMPSGYSSLGGQVLNPYDADNTPSGSSAGSGVAAATGLAAVTVGTETSGSIISPSAANGIVGLRPTVGLVSRAGILPISASQDTAGPMTRTVADAAAELQAIAGPDAEDPATDGQPPVPDYLDALSEDALEGARLGVVNSGSDAYQAAVAAVQAAGATTVPIPTPQPSQNFPQILTQEFERDLNAYLDRLPDRAPMDSLSEIVAFNSEHAQDALKFGQTQLIASEAVDLSDPAQHAEYVANRDGGRAATRAAIDDALTADDLDAILTPGTTLIGTGARAGYPQLTVPAGYDEGDGREPENVSFTGTAYSEATLLALGHAYEQATRLRRPPSEINPSMWRCVPGSAFFAPRSCAP